MAGHATASVNRTRASAVRRLVRQPVAVALGIVPANAVRRLPSGSVKSVLLVLLATRLRIRPVNFDPVGTPYGFRIGGNTRDAIQRSIFVFGCWEPNLSAWMTKHLRPGDVMIDVGANIGYFTCLAA